ncbi:MULTISPECIES: hypothetical protein [Xanthomonas]|nr:MULTISPECIES: hypothetical protein [Xanthomonas]
MLTKLGDSAHGRGLAAANDYINHSAACRPSASQWAITSHLYF